jgi:uncharacterized membrane protein YhhN
VLPWGILTVTALAGLLVAEARGEGRWISVWKPLASCGFLGLAIAAGALESAYGRVLLVALVLSWVGDVLLISREPGGFLAGLASFLLAHLAYAGAFLVRGPSWGWAAAALVGLVAPYFLVDRWLSPHVKPSLRGLVRIYGAAISVMMALACGVLAAGHAPVIFTGALAFYLSDLAVARDRFVREGFVNRLWGLPLYYASQLLLAWSVALP